MEQAFQDYVTRMAKIRHLSLPAIHDVDSAEAYRDRLCESFDAIGRLALENRAFLNETLYPLLRSDEALTPEMAENLRALCEQLFFVGGIEEDENLDLPVMSMIIQRLVVDTRQKGEISKLFDLNKLELFADYGMMDVARRIVVNPQFAASLPIAATRPYASATTGSGTINSSPSRRPKTARSS